mmetsp:Transcript_25038/g.52387  ORF Transcript_25038/g.52387 Transcript_25038/m.52387 type:complete len:416 (+) Transcript_25038:123-1370(+)
MPYQLSSKTMSGYPHHQPKSKSSASVVRDNIKSKSHLETKAQWKDTLRRGCLERAKNARRERLRTSRRHLDGPNNSGTNGRSWGDGIVSDGSGSLECITGSGNVDMIKRGRENSHPDEWSNNEFDYNVGVNGDRHTHVDNNDEYGHGVQRSSNRGECMDREENIIDAARTLVEQELQRALTGVQHCHQVCPVDGGIPWKKMHHAGEEGGAGDVRDVDFMEGEELAVLREREEAKHTMEGEYKISQEEFSDLLNDVTEELQREEELLEEEMWEMERAEAMERERLLHQIDDFDSWEELHQQQQQQQRSHQQQPSTYISPMANLNSPLVTCPICNSCYLTETPHDGIKCTNNNCTFQLDIAHEGLTLNHLKNQLAAIYEEHSRVSSRGILKFRMEERAGVSMLMAKSDACSFDVVVL